MTDVIIAACELQWADENYNRNFFEHPAKKGPIGVLIPLHSCFPFPQAKIKCE